MTWLIRWWQDWRAWRHERDRSVMSWAEYREFVVRWRAAMDDPKRSRVAEVFVAPPMPTRYVRVPEPLTSEQADLVMALYAQLQPAEYGMDAEVVMDRSTFDLLRPREVQGQPQLFGMRIRVDDRAVTPRLEPLRPGTPK